MKTKIRKSKVSIALSTVAVVALGAATYFRMAAFLKNGATPTEVVLVTVLPFLLFFAILTLVLAVLYNGNAARTRLLREQDSEAYIGQVAPNPTLAKEVRDISMALGLDAKTIGTAYLSVVVNSSHVNLVTGFRQPRVLVSIPVKLVSVVDLGSAEAGGRTLPTIRFTFVAPIGVAYRVDTVLYRTRLGFPLSVGGADTQAAVDKINAIFAT